MKISVTGIRGKSTFVRWMEQIFRRRGMKTLAKVTGGEDPHWIHNGEILHIIRPHDVVFLNETLDFKKYDYDVLIAENQAISAYTMQVFNDMVKPDVISITNIRLDHGDTMGMTKPAIARSTGYGFTKCKSIVSGEVDESLNEILRYHASRVGASFSVAPAPPPEEKNPLAPLVELASATLTGLQVPILDSAERDLLSQNMHSECCYIRIDNGILWFNGAKLNDTDSADQMLDYLLLAYPDDLFTVVAYLRTDRPGRTEEFIPWFDKVKTSERVPRILLAGDGCKFVARKLGGGKIKAIDETLPPDEVINMCTGSVIFLCCNAVNNFMIKLKQRLGEVAQQI